MLGRRIFGLDVMRALAISLVLFSHYLAGVGHIGRYGVEIFFILSGFLIGGILLDELHTHPTFDLYRWKNFLVRRWFRTLPNYYLFLFIHIVLFIYLFKVAQPHALYKYFFFFQFFIWNRQEFFGESWSLCVEEWFYLLFSGALFLGQRMSSQKNKIFIVVTLIFLIIPIFLRIMITDPNLIKLYIVVFRLDSMMYGVLLSYINKYLPHYWMKLKSNFWLGVFLFISIAICESFYFNNQQTFENIVLTLTPISIFIMLPQISSVSPTHWDWVNNVIIKTSLWSYSLYLVHLPVMQSLKIILASLLLTVPGKIAFKFICLIFTITFSRFIYLYFERPVTNLRDKV